MTYTYCCVYSARLLMMDRKTVQNPVEFYSKNKCEKLVHLVGFIIRIYHDARSSECHMHYFIRCQSLPGDWKGIWKFDLDVYVNQNCRVKCMSTISSFIDISSVPFRLTWRQADVIKIIGTLKSEHKLLIPVITNYYGLWGSKFLDCPLNGKREPGVRE